MRGERSSRKSHTSGAGAGAGGQGQPKKNLFKIFNCGKLPAAGIAFERHFDLGLGMWTPTASIHARGVVSPSLGDILPKRVPTKGSKLPIKEGDKFFFGPLLV